MPGVLLIQGMSLRFPAGSIVLSLGDEGTPQVEPVIPQLRLDLWPTWLEVGCQHTDDAADAGSSLSPELPDEEKGEVLTRELRAGLVAIVAFAFAFDGFYDVVRSECGDHPDAATWRGGEGRRPTARHVQVAETLRFHLQLGPQFTAQLKQFLQELFRFRGRAAHPSSNFLDATYRVEVDAGVHPDLVTFSGRHAVQVRAVALVVLERLLDRAAELSKPDDDTAWIERGRGEVARLADVYRVPGDDVLAFPPPSPDDGAIARTTEERREDYPEDDGDR